MRRRLWGPQFHKLKFQVRSCGRSGWEELAKSLRYATTHANVNRSFELRLRYWITVIFRKLGSLINARISVIFKPKGHHRHVQRPTHDHAAHTWLCGGAWHHLYKELPGHVLPTTIHQLRNFHARFVWLIMHLMISGQQLVLLVNVCALPLGSQKNAILHKYETGLENRPQVSRQMKNTCLGPFKVL
jgi:hypothetical protein